MTNKPLWTRAIALIFVAVGAILADNNVAWLGFSLVILGCLYILVDE